MPSGHSYKRSTIVIANCKFTLRNFYCRSFMKTTTDRFYTKEKSFLNINSLALYGISKMDCYSSVPILECSIFYRNIECTATPPYNRGLHFLLIYLSYFYLFTYSSSFLGDWGQFCKIFVTC